MSRSSFHYRNRFTWIQCTRCMFDPILSMQCKHGPHGHKKILTYWRMCRALRMTSGLAGETYEDRLIEVGLTSLEARRLRCDLIQTLKILHGYDTVVESSWFSRTCDTANRLTRQDNCSFNLNVKQFK